MGGTVSTFGGWDQYLESPQSDYSGKSETWPNIVHRVWCGMVTILGHGP